MTCWFVTRHKGAQHWIQQNTQIQVDSFVEHIQLKDIHAGDVVIGILPMDMVAQLCAKGVRFLNLVMDLREQDRGQELSAQDMVARNARLIEVKVWTSAHAVLSIRSSEAAED